MAVWKRLSVAAKLLVCFGLVFLASTGLGVFGLSQTAAVNDRASEIRDNWLPSTVSLAQLVAAVKENRVRQARVVISALAHDAAALGGDVGRARATEAEVEKAYAAYAPLIAAGTRDEELMKRFVAAWAKLKSSNAEVIELATRGNLEGMTNLYYHANRDNYDETVTSVSDDLAFNAAEGVRTAEAGAQTYATARVVTIAAIIGCGVLCLGVGLIMRASLGVPIRQTAEALGRLAKGELDVVVGGTERGDEIGLLARSLDGFKRDAAEARRLTAAQEVERAAKEQRAAHLTRLVRGFEAQASSLAEELAAASTGLEGTARSMSATAEEASGQAAAVAAAAEETSAGVQTVAASAEELTSSIAEINRQVAQSSQMTAKATQDARRSEKIVHALADGAQKIGDVVNLISSIAGQTNLLALNATIEAARAGDAGKGFAVVASEVKALASQTARATGEIAEQISQIQAATRDAVASIESIAATIEEVNGISTGIAAAVEQQGAATGEITRNVQQTAAGTQQVTVNITGVSQAAETTGAAARKVLAAAGELSQQAGRLTSQVHGFVAEVQAA